MKSSRENVPSSRCDLSMTGTCGAIPCWLTSPIEVGGRAIGGVSRQPCGLDAKADFGPLDHGLRGADLGLPDGARGFDIHDNPKLHVDQIVVGVGEECRPSQRVGPLGGRIGRRHELRGDVARRTKGRVIKSCQILLHGPARRLAITGLLPFKARDRAMLVGIGLDQARIPGKPLTTNKTRRDTGLHDTLEYPAKDATVPEPLVARPRKYRVIGDLVLSAKLTEPAV